MILRLTLLWICCAVLVFLPAPAHAQTVIEDNEVTTGDNLSINVQILASGPSFTATQSNSQHEAALDKREAQIRAELAETQRFADANEIKLLNLIELAEVERKRAIDLEASYEAPRSTGRELLTIG